jgi:molecular chaperone GrpE
MTDDPTRESAEGVAGGASPTSETPAPESVDQTQSNGRDTGETTPAAAGSASETEAAAPQFERRWSKRAQASQRPPEVSPAANAGLAAELEQEKARANELFERLQRSMADLSNYRKRSESEREEVTKFANMLLVSELLPVLDNFERALAAIPRELEQFTWLQGIALIERHLRALLEREGLQTIEAAGTPFNPSFHEAIVEEEAADVAPGTVIGEMQRGYTMHGRVIRPTLAKVSKAPGAKAESSAETPQEVSAPVDQAVSAETEEQDGEKPDGS